ncbi:hypothetical protein J4731_01625 [Providencia rettgeri]|nr:hypothetical protein [Providencia rettgeri]
MQLHDFGFVNYAVLFGYLAAMLLVGVYFSKRQKQRMIIFVPGAGSQLGCRCFCLCNNIKLNYLYVNSSESLYF